MCKKKKKLILFPCLASSIGGSHLCTITLLKKISAIGYDYIVILINEGVLENKLKENKIKFIKVSLDLDKSFNSIFYLIKSLILNFKSLSEIIKKYKPYAVHTNELKMHYLWSTICWIKKIPHIWHQHSAFYSRRNIFFSALSSNILTVSEFCKNSFTQKMSKRAKVIYNPFDIDKYEKNRVNKKIFLKKIKLNPERHTIAFFGSDSKQKGFHSFLKIIKEIEVKYGNKFNYLIVGRIKNKEEIFSLNLNGKVNIIDFNNVVENYIKVSDIIIFPSNNEGFGRILVEAMLLKTYFIASNSGSHKELITNNHNGFLSNKNSTEEYVKIIFKILKNKTKYNKILNNAFTFAKSKFNVQKYLIEIKKNYDDINLNEK